MQVKIELNQLDRAIRSKLAKHREPCDEHARRDQESVVAPAGDQLGEIIEPDREPVDNANQLKDLEIGGRGLAARSALRRELPVEVLEESWGWHGRFAAPRSRPAGFAMGDALLSPPPDALEERRRYGAGVVDNARIEDDVLLGGSQTFEFFGSPDLVGHGLRIALP